MTKLIWDKVGERLYENGVDHGVLYLPNVGGIYDSGYVWNGLTAVTESPTGAEANPQYADNIKYLNLTSAEEFGGTIEAFTYPKQFGQCDGSVEPEPGVIVGQQPRKSFGFSFRTRIGNDLNQNLGYKLHLVYNAMAAPSEKANNTVNDSPEAVTFSWEITTTGAPVTGHSPTSNMVIDSTTADPEALAALEDLLYGTVSLDPSLPTPDEVIALFGGTITVATPTAPTYNDATDTITVPTVTGVTYRRTDTNAIVTGAVVITANLVVRAYPNAGYVFPSVSVDRWLFTYTP